MNGTLLRIGARLAPPETKTWLKATQIVDQDIKGQNQSNPTKISTLQLNVVACAGLHIGSMRVAAFSNNARRSTLVVQQPRRGCWGESECASNLVVRAVHHGEPNAAPLPRIGVGKPEASRASPRGRLLADAGPLSWRKRYFVTFHDD